MDKFANYFSNNPKRVQELSEYVHKNFHLISTKMLSEMRRKLKITPDMQNSNGYVSLMVSLYGRMFNELVYGLCGICQAFKLDLNDVLSITTIEIFNNLLKGENALNGEIRSDIKSTMEEKQDYYLQHINFLRRIEEALPEHHFEE